MLGSGNVESGNPAEATGDHCPRSAHQRLDLTNVFTRVRIALSTTAFTACSQVSEGRLYRVLLTRYGVQLSFWIS